MVVPFDADEVKRLSVLESLDLLDTPADEAFDRITRLASLILEGKILDGDKVVVSAGAEGLVINGKMVAAA